MTGFGLVTQNNLPAFTPFNSSQPFLPTNATTVAPQIPLPTALGVGLEQGQQPVSDQQQQIAYTAWTQAAIQNAIGGITQYQWGQANLTTPPVQNQTPVQSSTNVFIPALGQQNQSPNDGYQASVFIALLSISLLLTHLRFVVSALHCRICSKSQRSNKQPRTLGDVTFAIYQIS